MAAKKKSPRNDFSNNPFKDLKGLSVSDERVEKSSAKQKAPAPPPLAKPVQKQEEDPRLFEQEMGWLGVQRLTQDAPPNNDVRQEGDSTEQTMDATVTQEDDETLLALAMDGVEATFKDDWPADQSEAAAPRRRRQLKRGHVKPEAELDLHGLTREEALTRVGHFLENARHHGFRVVLVITGKGTRADGEGVLRSAVGSFLSNQPGMVLEWFEAPRQYGGSGALVVFLRRERDV